MPQGVSVSTFVLLLGLYIYDKALPHIQISKEIHLCWRIMGSPSHKLENFFSIDFANNEKIQPLWSRIFTQGQTTVSKTQIFRRTGKNKRFNIKCDSYLRDENLNGTNMLFKRMNYNRQRIKIKSNRKRKFTEKSVLIKEIHN